MNKFGKVLLCLSIPVLMAGTGCGIYYGIQYHNIDKQVVEDDSGMVNVVDELRKSVESLEKDKANLTQQLSLLQEQYDALNQLRQNLENTNNSLETENAELQMQFEELDNQKVQLETQITNLNNQITSLNTQIKDLKETLNNEKNSSNEKIVELEIQISSLNGQISSLNTDIGNLNAEIDSYETNTIALNTQIANLNNTIAEYEQEIENYKQIIEELKKINSCVVTFIVDGEVFSTQQVNKTESPVAIDNPTSESYIFDGWTIAGSTEIIDPFTYSVTEDIEFVASIRKYKVITFTVDDEVVSTQSIVTDDELQLPTEPTKEHYIFLGWSVDGINVIDLTSYSFTQDTNLIAVFEVTGVLPYTFSGTKLTGYTGSDSEIVIPSSYSIVEENVYVEGNDYSVKSIGDDAFANNSTISKVTISNGITSIGKQSFRNCSNLSVLTIGEDVTSIGNSAFQLCINLLEVHYNAKNMTDRTQNNYIFCCSVAGSNSVYSKTPFRLIIGKNVKRIPAYLFASNNPYTVNIGSVEFEENSVCEEIGKYAFASNYSTLKITEIEIPENLKTLGDYAFYGCENVNKVYYNAINFEKSFWVDSNYINHEFESLGANTGVNVIFGNKVKTIPKGLFCYRGTGNIYTETPNIVSVSFEENSSCETINNGVFYGCSNLVDVELPNSLINLGDNVFYKCNISYTTYENGLYLGNSQNPHLFLMDISDTSVNEFNIHQNTKRIFKSAISGTTNLTSLTIPANVDYIYPSAFSTSGINTLIILGNDTQLMYNQYFALYACSNLQNIEISSDNIYYSFENGMLFNKDKTELHYYCLGKTETSVEIPNSVKIIKESAFYYNKTITNVIIPNGVELIGGKAFYECENLTSINIPASVTSIGSLAFAYCRDVDTIFIPSSVTEISSSAFSSCGTTNKNINLTIESAYAYNNASSVKLLDYSTTISVLKSIVDDANNSNDVLNDTSKYTKSENGNYYVYVKV